MSIDGMVILTYEDLYGSKMSMEDIINRIRNLDIKAIAEAAYIIANKDKLKKEFIGAYFQRNSIKTN